MNSNGHILENVALVGVMDPVLAINTTQVSDIIDMGKYEQLAFILLIGNVASETIDFKVQCDALVAFGSGTDVKAATQRSASSTANDNKQIVIIINGADVEAAVPGDRFVRATVTTGATTNGPMAMIILGKPKYGPGTLSTLNMSADTVEIKL